MSRICAAIVFLRQLPKPAAWSACVQSVRFQPPLDDGAGAYDDVRLDDASRQNRDVGAYENVVADEDVVRGFRGGDVLAGDVPV